MKKQGFTLIELMVVVAIIALLAMIAIPSFTTYVGKAKRAEAYMNLHAMYAAQKAYWIEHGKYSETFAGLEGIGWKPEGYHGGGSDEKFYYTYGFGNGSEGINYFTGKLETAAQHLGRAYAHKDEFLMVAAGAIGAHGKPDILAIDHHNNITILQDGLN